MSIQLFKIIDNLPPLPKTIMKLDEFNNMEDKEYKQLVNILIKDPLLTATILKVANSAMFGFQRKIDTVDKAVNLLGFDFTLSIAFGCIIKQTINTDLRAYGLSADDFLTLSSCAARFMKNWISPLDKLLASKLILPVFLQETGKFILSDMLIEQNKADAFLSCIKNNNDIAAIEKEFLGLTTSEVTASLFEHWNLDEYLINVIRYVDQLEYSCNEFQQASSIMKISKVMCNLLKPVDDSIINLVKKDAHQYAKKYTLDSASLNCAIEKML